MTTRQKLVRDYIAQFVASRNYSPSVRDIGAHFGYSPNGVMCHLRALRRDGAVTCEVSESGRMLARTLRVTGASQ